MTQRALETRIERGVRLRRPIKLPAKKHKIRYGIARTRNAVRSFRRVKYDIYCKVRHTSDWLGADYSCTICGETVLYRRADEHNFNHRLENERAKGRKPLSPEERSERKVTALPRTPSKSKASATSNEPRRMFRRGAKDGEEVAAPNTNRAPRSAASSGGSSSPAQAMVAGMRQWCEYRPASVSELRAHLLEAEKAFGQMSELMQQFAAEAIVGQRIHPSVAKPIDIVAMDLASTQNNFSQAYAIFERFYADRLAYERTAAQVRPDDSMFKDVG